MPGAIAFTPDALTPHLSGDTSDEANDAGLGRGVGGTAMAAERGHRGDADDGAAAPLGHGGNRGLGGEQHGLEIHRHHAVPILLGRLEDVLAGLDAHVVVEDVKAAVRRHRGRDHGPAVGRASDVRGESGGGAALALDDGHRLFGAGELRVHTEDGRALPSEQNGGGLAVAEARPARPGARDDRDLAREAAAHRLSS
jgi:hypothetical protein